MKLLLIISIFVLESIVIMPQALGFKHTMEKAPSRPQILGGACLLASVGAFLSHILRGVICSVFGRGDAFVFFEDRRKITT